MADKRPPAQPTSSPAPAARSYTDDELVRRTEEFNQAAELYWQRVRDDPSGRRHALDKPLSTLVETPDILYRLGLVLEALDLGVGLTVLDLGAGSCWLASHLNRLRCRTVAMDVSPTALELGRERFLSDARHHPELEPRFLAYDGHRLGLPDASVDRVVMFDAFHHVPNQQEILEEIARVLKPGGRAVFGEPGEGHSHSDQSLFESGNTGVLENDLDVADVERKALRAGFTRVLLKPYPRPSLALPAADYRRLIAGEEALYPMALLREDLRHFYVFILEKGAPCHDSRNPRRLRAAIALDGPPRLVGRARALVPFRARVRNEGDTLWLAQERPEGGFVTLGASVYGQGGRLLERAVVDGRLPRDVAPGDQVELEGRLQMPAPPGRYLLKLDLVDEHVGWFAQFGSPVAEAELVVEGWLDSRAPHRLLAELQVPGPVVLRADRPGVPLRLAVRARNTGDSTWLAAAGGAGAVALGGHLRDAGGGLLDWDFLRCPLPRDVEPGQGVELECEPGAPPEPGRYRLELDLVAEQVGWFESWGSPRVELQLEVGEGQADSRAPGRLVAELELASPEPRPLRARAGRPLQRRVRARNAGNTLWLASPGPGQVLLGGHLRAADGRLLEQDFLRAALPGNVAPGAQAELQLAAPAPDRPGSYVLELDLLVEGLCWFGTRGSGTLSLPLDVD